MSKFDIKSIFLSFMVFLIASLSLSAFAGPDNFTQAKMMMRKHIYYDQNKGGELGTIYCGCDWQWVDEISPRSRASSAGRTDMESCDYKNRSPNQLYRAERIEWEHIIPAHTLGNMRQCWQNGGRKNCTSNDPVFSKMEANMFNLTVSIGEVNADRSNYNFGMVSNAPSSMYGQCKSKADFKSRTFEPRNEAKGLVARTNFYMADRYDLRLSRSQQQMFMAWDKQYPPSKWEKERNARIAKHMGHQNEFVTGARKWTLGHKNSAEGVFTKLPETHPVIRSQRPEANNAKAMQTKSVSSDASIYGNTNSKIYHLPVGCPSYDRVSERNRQIFNTEAEAQAAGYRKAGNCK